MKFGCFVFLLAASIPFIGFATRVQLSDLERAESAQAFVAEFKTKAANAYFEREAYLRGVFNEEYDNHAIIFTPSFVAKIQQNAEEGDTESQALYGCALLHGWGVESDQIEAIKWLTKAADTDNPFVQDYLGECYFYGIALDKDIKKGLEWIQKAANLGYAPSQRILGFCYFFGYGISKNRDLGISWCKKAADQGDQVANSQLWEWDATEKSESNFRTLCENADHGDVNAQMTLGMHYENGYSNFGFVVEKDEAKAFGLYRAAAEKGNTEALFRLGRCYEKGIGIDKNDKEAFVWYSKAANAGVANANRILGWCYQTGSGVDTDIAQAVKQYSKAADLGDTLAQIMLADCYYFGEGVETNFFEAARLYSKAAENGNLMATYCLGECYRYGVGVAKDLTAATRLFRKVSGKDSDYSKFDLALELPSLIFDVPESYHHILAQIRDECLPIHNEEVLRNKLVILSLLRHYRNDTHSLEYLRATPNPSDNELLYRALFGLSLNNNDSKEWKTIDGKTFLGTWTTSSREIGFIRIDSKNKEHKIIYVDNLCEDDAVFVWQKTLDYMFDKRYEWVDGFWVTKDNWDGIKKAATLINEKSLTAHQYVEIFEILDKNSALAFLGMENQQSHSDNRPVIQLADFNIGDIYSDKEKLNFDRLYWASTFSYKNKKGDTRTVTRFSPNYSLALYFIRKAMHLYDDTDPILGNPSEESRKPTDGNWEPNNKNAQKGKKENDDIWFGSVFFVTEDGYFLTNNHVVDGADKLEIILGNECYSAILADFDSDIDLALLKVVATNTPFLSFSNKRMANLGEDVFAVGFPRPTLQGASVKVTKGVISSLRGIMDDPHCYQIDAAIQPGNSGGPIVDANGDVVGIAVAKLKNTESMMSSGDIVQNVNYAIKSSFALAFLDSTPECKYKIGDGGASRMESGSGLDEQVPKACGLVIAYRK